MTPKNILWALLALMLAAGMSESLYGAVHVRAPTWWMALSSFLMSFLPYYWYRLDSETRLFPRSRWMSTAVVALAPIGIPVYLVRSRPKGARLRSLYRMSGFVVLMCAAAVVGAGAFFFMPG
ncbi:hypothetical protein [Massilia consociata]|uniref:Uncharacterized protein n=1 Tax=Massilia consociata TaxID=760117 RepID=A0ABV6FF16_9BURK